MLSLKKNLRGALLGAMLCGLAIAATADEKININSADAATLAAAIDGIGPARAAAIVDWRAANGPFKTVDDLLLVKGIGAATLTKNRAQLTATTPAH